MKVNLGLLGDTQILSRDQLRQVYGGTSSQSSLFSCEGGCTEDKDCPPGQYCDTDNPCSTDPERTDAQCKVKN